MARISMRYKRYPSDARPRGERGTASVYFTIDGTGNVLSAKLVRSSGFSALDQEVVSAIRRASPVPAPPPSASRTITVPMRFSPD
jgi:periplasmic protein TonB